MLQKLIIKNIALIDNVEINFSEGLNVLSGETGAGKSVIIESINFVLGAKADKTLIRTGTNECSVLAIFDVKNNSTINQVYDEFEFEHDDELIISRKFSDDGKSSVKVNGNSVTISMLKKLTSSLVDVHGQSEHFHLLKNSNQLDLIDKFGGLEISKQKSKLKDLFLVYKDYLNEYDKFGGSESDRLVKIDILNYQISEIEAADIKPDEEETLYLKKEQLKHQEKIFNALNSLKSAICEEGGVNDTLSNVSRQIYSLVDLGNNYSELYDRICNAYSELDDISSSASAILDNIDSNNDDIDAIEERISQIKSLKKKYGNDYNVINTFLENAKNEREKLENFNDLSKDLEDKIYKTKKEIFNSYIILSDIRRKYSNIFTKNVINELEKLSMPKAKFEVRFNDNPNFNECKFDSANGFDNLEFMFSANLGEPLKPLAMIISGGEMSRFMLAVKTQSSKHNDISTFIFDEIDSGISGITARVVAEKFADISKDKQIIAITHLPQISAMADNNLLIVKTDDGEKTNTNIKQLSFEEKVLEIIRLSGGDITSIASKKHAEELIKLASVYKNKT